MKKILTYFVLVLIGATAVAEHHGTAAAEVREAVRAFNSAYAENRVDEYFDYYAEDAQVYFYGARQDLAAYQDEWQAMAESGGGVEQNALSDVRIQVMPSGDIAVATYFVDYRYRAPDGTVTASNAFESEVWRKIDGEWKIVNLHYSEITPAD